MGAFEVIFSGTSRLGGLAVAAVLMLAILTAPGSSAGASARSKCTIIGSKHSDSLVGTDRRDVICAGAGNDRVKSRGGRDLIRAGEGDDRVRGGAGADLVAAGDGNDRVEGNAGDDEIFGDDGDDELAGGPDSDNVVGGAGSDTCDFGDLDAILDTSCLTEISVRSVSISPGQVDTSTSDRQLYIETTVKDMALAPGEEVIGVRAATGFDFEPYAGFINDVLLAPGEELHPVEPAAVPSEHGPAAGGGAVADTTTWAGPITVPRYSQQGRHRVSLVVRTTSDLGGHWWPIWSQGLARAGLPHEFEQVGRGGGNQPEIGGLTSARGA